MLSLRDISITLGRGTTLARPILQGLNLDVSDGEFIVIIGGNGAGKSTLFNVISGMLPADSGEIRLDGRDVAHVPQHRRAASFSRVMQDPRVGTVEAMTIAENMAFAYRRGQRRGILPSVNSRKRNIFREHLSVLGMGLETRLDDLVSHLSGGQRQALSLMMAILTDARVLLLDEITAALDPKMAESVMKIAADIVTQKKRTTIMITHNMAHALDYGDRTLHLAGGKIVKELGDSEKQQYTPQALAAEFEAV